MRALHPVRVLLAQRGVPSPQGGLLVCGERRGALVGVGWERCGSPVLSFTLLGPCRGARPPVWPVWSCAHLCPKASPGLAVSQLWLTPWGQSNIWPHSLPAGCGQLPQACPPLCAACFVAALRHRPAALGAFSSARRSGSSPLSSQAFLRFLETLTFTWSWPRVASGG